MNEQARQVWRGGKAYPMAPEEKTPAERAMNKHAQALGKLGKGKTSARKAESSRRNGLAPVRAGKRPRGRPKVKQEQD